MLVRIVKKILKPFYFSVAANVRFIKDYLFFKRNNDGRFDLSWKKRFPCLSDRTATTSFDPHYIYHTAWAARVLREISPEVHFDISSSLYFVSIASSFCNVRFFDYRPSLVSLSNLSCHSADLLNLPFASDSIRSLSCMHVVEHVGLGRYGDTLDISGDLKAIAELKRVLKIGGDLIFVVPLGGEAEIQYNAHRIYTYSQILNYFNGFDLVSFSLVADTPSVEFLNNPSLEIVNQQKYGCGCFWFRKI